MNREPQIIKESANQYDTIDAMRQVSYHSAKNPIFKKFIQENRLSPEDLPRLYKALYKLIDFQRDPVEIQTIRTGSRSLEDRTANCVDFSVLISCFLLNMGIPHVFRMVSFDGDSFSHIYPVLANGEPFDLVLGKEFKEMPGEYGKEIPFKQKFDLPILKYTK